MIDTIPLFDPPEPERLKPAQTIAQAERGRRPSWAKWTGTRVACDECVIFLHENCGNGPHPRSARRVRTVRSTGDVLRLCNEHAELRRVADQAA